MGAMAVLARRETREGPPIAQWRAFDNPRCLISGGTVRICRAGDEHHVMVATNGASRIPWGIPSRSSRTAVRRGCSRTSRSCGAGRSTCRVHASPSDRSCRVRFGPSPTFTCSVPSAFRSNETTEGVASLPSGFFITSGKPVWGLTIAISEYVVPKSMPQIRSVLIEASLRNS